eukprot:gene30539-36908_t
MDDSSLSASELRHRYHRGGTVPDDELTSAQLRARHAIPSNTRDFSTRDDSQGQGNAGFLVIVAVVAVVAIGAIAYFVLNK